MKVSPPRSVHLLHKENFKVFIFIFIGASRLEFLDIILLTTHFLVNSHCDFSLLVYYNLFLYVIMKYNF